MYFINNLFSRKTGFVLFGAKTQKFKFCFLLNFTVVLSMAKKRGLSADEKKQKMLEAMLAGVNLCIMLIDG